MRLTKGSSRRLVGAALYITVYWQLLKGANINYDKE